MTIDALALSEAAHQQSAAKKTELAGNFDMFLRLLTTQLQNQDPLQPTDTNQFTQQLVMYSQVEQQIKSNEQLSNLVNLQGNLQLQSALSYIGKEVRVADNRFTYEGAGDYSFDYALPDNAKTCRISILDENDNVVFTTNGDLVGSKLHTYKWNGKTTDGDVAPAGKYKISIAAQDSEGKAMTAETAVWAKVQGMETTADGQILLDLDGFGVTLADIMAARQPKTQPTI